MLEYIRFRLARDSKAAFAWFGEKWRDQVGCLSCCAFALIALVALWIVAWAWLASDLAEADSLTEYQTPLPTVVRGIDGEIVHSYARERRVQLQYADFPEPLIGAYLSAEDKTFFSHGGVDVTGTANAVI